MPKKVSPLAGAKPKRVAPNLARTRSNDASLNSVAVKDKAGAVRAGGDPRGQVAYELPKKRR
jgi:hypothetical protein